MGKETDRNNDAVDKSNLRKHAEETLNRRPNREKDIAKMSPGAIRSLVHELSVHQIELEIQNEELRRIQDELELTRDKYLNLYNFSPVGHFTVNEKGIIEEANLTGAVMFDTERKKLIGMPFTRFIKKEDQDIFYLHRTQLLETQSPHSFELRMVKKNGREIHAYLMCMLVKDDGGDFNQIRAAVSDITERIKNEQALKASEEKYRLILDNIEEGYYEVDLAGKFTFFNDSLCRILGYSCSEMMGMNNREYMDQENAKKMFQTFNRVFKTGAPSKVIDREIIKKNGTKRYVGTSVSLIKDVDGNATGFRGILQDITERKQREAMIQLRLTLWEIAAERSVNDLMQTILDEIEALTDSLIGFYHFVEEEQNTLTLQAWSTRTRNEFCKAEGEGLHYSIDKAGIWADCVRLRRPVIHNDYASLPNRKGMPAGHAEVIRELVVPILRDGRVVSILGVGNKPSDYTDDDIELVDFVADLLWTIIKQKRADEQIRQLNSRLESLAMTDELTGLANRRSFFFHGVEEIKRAQRYQSSLALIMLDIDAFKEINDRYGHDVGDMMLQCVAKIIRETIRDVDLAVRLGGEEFGVLMPNTKVADAVIFAERLRLAIERESCSVQNQSIGLTASVGVATYSEEIQNLDVLLRNADTAMYKAKNQGRNRVVMLD